MQDRPEGIIITISQQMLKERGIVNWYRDFYRAATQEGWLYYFRLGNKPKIEPLYVYLLIGGKIKLRVTFVMFENEEEKTFADGRKLKGKVWCVMQGPLVKAPKRREPERKGFQGFRYTEKLF